MKLISIEKSQFSEWKAFRRQIYSVLDEQYDSQEMEQIYSSDDWFCFFIGNENEDIVGLVELSSRNIVDNCLSSPVAYLEGLYIDEDYRNQGLGEKTLELILDWCHKNGFQELATDTEIDNDRAQKFYKNFGFKETDRVVEFRIDINK